LGNLFVTLKHFPCDISEDHELYANEEQNCSELWLEFLQKWIQSLIGCQFSVPELCTDFSETAYPSNIPTENNRKGLSPVRLVAMKILPQTAHDTGSTGLSPRKRHEESEVRHCWCEVWHHLVETKLNSF
jgi:hypothetical protein